MRWPRLHHTVTRRLLLLTTTLTLASQALARPGDWVEPIAVDSTPFWHRASPADRLDLVHGASCPEDDRVDGVEHVLAIEVTTPSLLRVEWTAVPDCTAAVTVLGRRDLSPTGHVLDCRARASRALALPVEADRFHILIEQPTAPAGCEILLRVDLEPLNTWSQRSVAPGVTLRTWRGEDDQGEPRFVALLDVDTRVPGVSLRPLQARGCVLTSQLGRDAGAVAALNGGFFGGPRCRSVSLLQIDGELLAFNSRPRAALGVDSAGALHIARIAPRLGWPEMRHALGGVPQLVKAGQAGVSWREEAARQDFAQGAHPRSAVAVTPHGALLLAVDGRTEAGGGMTLDELARFLVVQGAVDALNLDGGGSTTLWVRGEPGGGVINHPSDNGLADHAGERPVANALGVFAPAREPRLFWVTRPPGTTVGPAEVWNYEALAVADDGSRVRYRLETGGASGALLVERSDGSAQVELRPSPGPPRLVRLVLHAQVGGGPDLAQRLDVAVVEEFAP